MPSPSAWFGRREKRINKQSIKVLRTGSDEVKISANQQEEETGWDHCITAPGTNSVLHFKKMENLKRGSLLLGFFFSRTNVQFRSFDGSFPDLVDDLLKWNE